MRHNYRIKSNPNQVTIEFVGKDPFDRWARGFFKAKRLNTFVPYKHAFLRYKEKVDPKITQLQFKRALSIWCSKKGFQLDPPEYWNSDKRIIRKHEVQIGLFQATEMIFIKTA